MKKENIKTALKVIFSLGLGILIFWYVYKDWDVDTLMDNLRGVRIIWIIIPLFIALLSHFLRAVRWKMLIDPLGKEVNLWTYTEPSWPDIASTTPCQEPERSPGVAW